MKPKTSRMKKIFAFVVTVAVLFTSLPMYAFATLIDNTSEIISNEETIDNALTKSEVVVLEEDVSLREENTKQFILSDGTVKAVSYSQPVHYKNENGEWIDINNALTLSGNEYEANNKSQIKFANKSGSTGLLSIKDGEYKIDFTPLNTNKVSVEIENPQSNNSRKFDDVKLLTNLVSRATYTNIYDGIDLEYILTGNNIKENIIVNTKQEGYVYTFELKLNKLSAKLEDNSIILSDCDTGEQIYKIPTPYMYDANGEISTGVEYSLTQNNKWKYTFIVSANAEWINSEERAFPVTIDPTVSVKSDAFFDATEYSNTVDSSGTLRVGNGYKTQISFLRIPSLPKDAYLTDATISLKHISGEEAYIGVYQYNTEKICDYNQIYQNKTFYENGAWEYNGTYGVDGWYTWNIYDIAYGWYNNNTTKTLELKAVSGTELITFESEETGDSNRPVLEITYRDMKGTESYWSYITQSADIAGNGAVNLATGNLVFEIPTLTTTDSLFCYTPTMVYNSAIAGEAYKYGNAQIGYWGSYAANGFKVSYNEALIKDYFVNSDGEEEIYYIWADSDGTEHYFFNDGETNVYHDEDGLQLTLTVNDSDVTQECIIKDSEFNSRVFAHMSGTVSTEIESTWYLSKIQDKNGNELYFQIDGSKKPNDVKVIPNGESAITMISPLYNSNSAVTLFWNNATKEAVLLRHSATPTSSTISTSNGIYLREVIHLTCDSSISWSNVLSFVVEENNDTDGITINSVMKYDYDSNGRLCSVNNDLSDYTLWYDYDDAGRVVYITEEGGQYALGDLGQTIGISYFAGYTEVRTSGADDELNTDDDLINVYTFDTQGRVITTYTTNTDRNEVYGLSSGTYDEGENSKNSIKTQFDVGTTSANYILNGSFEDSADKKYWSTSNNATEITNYSSDKCETSKLKFNLQYGAAHASQCVYLKSGKYTLSLDVRTDDAEDVELTISVGNQSEIVPISRESTTTDDCFVTATFDVDVESYSPVLVKIFARDPSFNVEIPKYVYIDNVMLAKSSGAVDYNLVTHGEFENTITAINGTISTESTNEGDAWVAHTENGYVAIEMENPNNSLDVSITDYDDELFENVLQINGDISCFRAARQVILSNSAYNIEGSENRTFSPLVFTVSGYSCAPEAMNSGQKSQYGLIIYYATKQNGEVVEQKPLYFPFNSSANTWQYISGTFVIPADMKLSYMHVACVYSNNVGTAYFDNICVTKSEGNNLYYAEYYENGKIKYEENGDSQSFYYYNSKGELEEWFNDDHRTCYIYDKNHNLIQKELHVYKGDYTSKNYEGILATTRQSKLYQYNTYAYDSYGLLLRHETLEITGNSPIVEGDKVITNYEYNTVSGSKIFGALKATTDSLGRVTRYFYNEKNGKLLAVIQPDNEGYIYSYNNMGQLVEVVPATYNGTTYSEVTNSANIEYKYNENAQLEKINANGVTYNISYDIFGNQESVSVGDNEIISQEFNEYNGKVIKTNYAAGTTVTYEYDHLERVSKATYTKAENSVVYTYEYHSNGNLSKVTNSATNTTTLYKYDINGTLIAEFNYATDTGIIGNSNYFRYNEKNQITAIYNNNNYLVSDETGDYYNMYVRYSYEYSDENTLSTLRFHFLDNVNTYLISYEYDKLGRIKEKVTNYDWYYETDSSVMSNTISYSYLQSETGSTSALISDYVSTIDRPGRGVTSEIFKFEYDSLGNITKVYSVEEEGDTIVLQYKYDSIGRIIREDNAYTQKTYIYEYDNNGNILSENVYNVTFSDTIDTALLTTNTYAYSNSEWKDILTSYNGEEIEYDSQGNQVSYGDLQFNWGETLNLKSIYENEELLASYTYNTNGIRTSKTVDGVTHIYSLNGTKVAFESYGEIFIVYIYDETGAPIGMAYRDGATADIAKEQEAQFTYYLFTKNLQGDIIGIYSQAGDLVAKYTYNAWGEHTVTNYTSDNIGDINPFRYRGYFYDTETGYYYLNSRYYNPQIKRFISADSYITTGQGFNGCNMFAYVLNNPVSFVDANGYSATAGAVAAGTAVAIGAVKAIGIGVAVTIATAVVVGVSYEVATSPAAHDFVVGVLNSVSNALETEKEDVIIDSDIAENNNSSTTYIYRYGTILYPTGKDVFMFEPTFILAGVSFSLDPPKNPNIAYYRTTMEQLNNSGTFIAVNDHGRHVTVSPTGKYGSIFTWYKDGEHHLYTYELRRLCIRMN